jgi:Reverse transcriptase (RNA-dependent DNA polymerase)
VKPRLKRKAHEIRFADDAVLCFQYREDAEKVLEVLPKRFARFGLTLHPEKTRLVDFGRYAEEHAKRQSPNSWKGNDMGEIQCLPAPPSFVVPMDYSLLELCGKSRLI